MKNLLNQKIRNGLLLVFVALAAGADLRAQEPAAAQGGEILFDMEKPKKKMILPNTGSEDEVETDVVKEGIVVKIKASGNSGFPGIMLKPSRPWKLSDYSQIDAVITNTCTVPLRINMRVDNDVPKVNDTWNANAVQVKPGETKTLTVTFGQSYGHAGYALDPKEIVQLLFFTGPMAEEQSFRIESLKATGSAAEKK